MHGRVLSAGKPTSGLETGLHCLNPHAQQPLQLSTSAPTKVAVQQIKSRICAKPTCKLTELVSSFVSYHIAGSQDISLDIVSRTRQPLAPALRHPPATCQLCKLPGHLTNIPRQHASQVLRESPTHWPTCRGSSSNQSLCGSPHYRPICHGSTLHNSMSTLCESSTVCSPAMAARKVPMTCSKEWGAVSSRASRTCIDILGIDADVLSRPDVPLTTVA